MSLEGISPSTKVRILRDLQFKKILEDIYKSQLEDSYKSQLGFDKLPTEEQIANLPRQ